MPLFTVIQLVTIFVLLGALAVWANWDDRRRRRAYTQWHRNILHVDGDDWELYDVQWRHLMNGRIEASYVIVNRLDGQHEYRNDFIRVFQCGVGLQEEGERMSHVLLKGAEVRFTQTFLTRDGSTPVIQIDPSYTE